MPDIQPSILSIQAGEVAPQGASGVLSGFEKRILRGPVEIALLGLTRDEEADLSAHAKEIPALPRGLWRTRKVYHPDP